MTKQDKIKAANHMKEIGTFDAIAKIAKMFNGELVEYGEHKEEKLVESEGYQYIEPFIGERNVKTRNN